MDKKDAYFESVKQPWKLPTLPSPNPTFALGGIPTVA